MLENKNIVKKEKLYSPAVIKQICPVPYPLDEEILGYRKEIEDIIKGKDKRLLLIVGPCSIHDPLAALEYAKKLKALQEKVADKFLIVMRVYFEKPRTTVGWKGLINDPNLDNTFQIAKGLLIARELMVEITRIGLPIGTEALDQISPQYLNDLVSWNAIGARTTESQTHREMASGLSAPVGFKNGTDGSIDIAINAILSAQSSHAFLGMEMDGTVAVFHTRGNKFGHLILRGGSNGSNYDENSVVQAIDGMKKAKITPRVIVDCSHANSNKDFSKQYIAFNETVENVKKGHSEIIGMMLESNINSGNQSLVYGKKDKLKYGVSITDGCIDWTTTENLIIDAYNKISE